MISVLHLCRRFFPQRGGSETYTGAMIPALMAAGIHNRVLAAGAPEADYFWQGVAVTRADDKTLQRNSGRSRFLDRYLELLDTHRPDIVHWHFLPDEAELLLEASALHGIRNVHTLHHPVTICPRHDLMRFGRELCDRTPNARECGPCMANFRGLGAALCIPVTAFAQIVPLSIKSNLPRSRLKTALLLANDTGNWIASQRRSLHSFDAHIVLSRASVEVLTRYGVDSRRIQVSRLGTHHLSPRKRAWTSWGAAQVNARPMRVIFVGRLEFVKGVALLADAASQFSAAELQLDIYGPPGDAHATVESFAAKPGSPIRTLGPLADEDVLERMSESDFVAIPSQFFETGPFTAVEALQAGTPILASNAPSLNEFVEDGQNGWLVERSTVKAWRDALRRAIDRPDLAAQMRQSLAYPRSMQDVANEMLTVYARITNASAG